jgi:uncharacterized BrkB/YihY/UPF0761 family membrane protein
MSRSGKAPCGCVEGFIGLLIGLALFARHYLAVPGSEPRLRTILTGIVFALSGAVVGKVVGLYMGRRQPAI